MGLGHGELAGDEKRDEGLRRLGELTAGVLCGEVPLQVPR